MSVAVLVLAAGRGERLGHSHPKAFVRLAGMTLLERSLRSLCACESVDHVLPVIGENERGRFDALELADLESKLLTPVPGGAERQDSVAAGLAALPAQTHLIAVHDAARCLVQPADVAAVIAAADRTGAALLAEPVRDTIKRVRGGRVIETPPRAECWAAQTPQAFRVVVLREALARATEENFLGTDDAQLVERLGVQVEVVTGPTSNLKITRPVDLAIAEAQLAAGDLWTPSRATRDESGRDTARGAR